MGAGDTSVPDDVVVMFSFYHGLCAWLMISVSMALERLTQAFYVGRLFRRYRLIAEIARCMKSG